MSTRNIRADLRGRIALMTGGAKGIGEAISNSFATSGASVAVNYNTSAERAEAMVREFQAGGVQAVAIQADVSDARQVESLISRAQEALGGGD